MGLDPVIARAAPHFWEEPCISGTRGSGTVFFSGCVLKCVYCQNSEISYTGKGKRVTPLELADMFKGLEEQGIMMPVRELSSVFVSPAHYDDLLTIKTRVVEAAGFKAVFEHEIFNQDGVKVNTGRVVLVYVDAVTRRITRAPKWFADLFAEE